MRSRNSRVISSIDGRPEASARHDMIAAELALVTVMSSQFFHTTIERLL